MLHTVAAALWTFCSLEVKRCVELSQKEPISDTVEKEDKFSLEHVHCFFGAALNRCIHALAAKEKRQGEKMSLLDVQRLQLYRAV